MMTAYKLGFFINFPGPGFLIPTINDLSNTDISPKLTPD